MTIFDEVHEPIGECQDTRVSMWMLDQMAEGLEDQAAGMSRRAAGFEEEESLICKEIAGHETEINRLFLRLEALRSDRDSVVQRIELLKSEANAIREQLSVCEEEAALAAIDPAGFPCEMTPTHQVYCAPITRPLNAA